MRVKKVEVWFRRKIFVGEDEEEDKSRVMGAELGQTPPNQ